MLEQCRALMETMMSGAPSWMGGMMPLGGGMMPLGGGMMLIGLVWLILLVAASVLIAWLVLRGRSPSTTDARKVLGVRYARGELDRETYLRMRADLTDHAPAAR
jgi:putative membrane protein